MRVEPPLRLAIVWRTGPYRCEYWKSRDRAGHLRLYEGPALRGVHVVQSVDEMRSVATSCRTELTQPPTAERREGADRRAMPQNGRRDTDPVPTCAACGLPLIGSHGSEAACAAAIVGEG